MTKKGKKMKQMVCAVLMLIMVASMEVSYSYAVEPRIDVDNDGFSFYLNLPEGGVTDLATAREKTIATTYASFRLTTITNNSKNSNHPLYVNVRNSTGGTIAGIAHEIANGTSAPSSFYVGYKTGYGNMGTKYRPSGQTDNDSTANGYVAGRWLP